MAKVSSASASPTKREEMRRSPIIEGLDLAYPILVGCDLDWGIQPESTGGEKPERFYDSGLRLSEDTVNKELTIAACFFSAGQKLKDKKFFEIRATYLIAVKHSGQNASAISKADRIKLLEETAGTAAWPLFRTLFAQLGSQTNLELPLLPNMPKLRWLKPEETMAKTGKKSA